PRSGRGRMRYLLRKTTTQEYSVRGSSLINHQVSVTSAPRLPLGANLTPPTQVPKHRVPSAFGMLSVFGAPFLRPPPNHPAPLRSISADSSPHAKEFSKLPIGLRDASNSRTFKSGVVKSQFS